MGIYGLADNIKYYRERREKTQLQIAEAIGVDASTIARYESGERVPSTECLVKMAAYLHIQVDDLTQRNAHINRKTNKNGLPIIDFQNGEIVRNQMFSQVCEPYVMITPDGIRFNSNCVRKWEDVDYVVMVIEKHEKLLVVRKGRRDDRDAQRWSTLKDGKKYGRKVTGRGFSENLYSIMNWSKGYAHKVNGYIGVSSVNQDEEILFFELDSAEGHPLSKTARAKSGVMDEQLSPYDIEQLNYIEEQKRIEVKERKEKREKGIDPGAMKKWVIYPNKWGQYTFGIPVAEYEPRKKIKVDWLENDDG